MNGQEIVLRLPAAREYIAVLRCTLGGVAVLYDLDVDSLDDLRNAADEVFDCLIHQEATAEAITMTASRESDRVSVAISADFSDDPVIGEAQQKAEMSAAVLETLIPDVEFECMPGGCIRSFRLSLRPAGR